MDIYVINLDKDLHRWHHISHHMNALGMPYSRWSATDGSTIDSSKFDNEPLEPGIFIRDFREWSRNEAACGISHIKLLQHLIRCQTSWAMILEDDGLLERAVPLDIILWEAPEDAELILLQKRAYPGSIRKQGQLFSYADVVGGAGTEGYLISFLGAQKLLKVLYPLKDPLDFQMYAHFSSIQMLDQPPFYWSLPRNNEAADIIIKAYALVPGLVTHVTDHYSSIGNQRHPRARYYCKVLLGIDFDRIDGYSLDNHYQTGTYIQSAYSSTAPTTRYTLKWKGVDISHFDERQQFYRAYGMPPDNLMNILRDNGVDTVRLSAFVGEDTQFNIQRTLRLAKFADEHGLRSYVVLHFSDTWTNPGRQQKPAKWNMLSLDELAYQVYQYSKEIVASLYSQGTPPSIIQIGNEITNGMLWATNSQPYTAGGRLSRHWEEGHPLPYDSQWFIFARLIKMAIRGVHDGMAFSEAKTKVMLHIDRGADIDEAAWWFQRVQEHQIEYDLIGLSFNPLWHEEARLENLYKMAALAKTFPQKEVIVAETSFPHRPFRMNKQMYFKGQLPFTQEGQRQYLVQALQILQHVPNVTGLFWWGTTFIHRSFHPDTDYFNARALFDTSGVALPALNAFLLP